MKNQAMKTLTLLCLLMVAGCREVKKPSPLRTSFYGGDIYRTKFNQQGRPIYEPAVYLQS